jgi:SAM-dependent methyltransferase
VDASRAMLEVARRRCPSVPLQHGSLPNLRLRRQFDVVTCLFGSIAYASTISSFTRAVKSLARHLEPNGVLVVEPWVAPARFESRALVCDVADCTDFKVARMYATHRQGRRAILNVHYLVGRRQEVTNFVERHELGLYSDDDYRRAFRAAGLVLRATSDLFGYGLYVCRKRPVRRKDRSGRRSA